MVAKIMCVIDALKEIEKWEPLRKELEEKLDPVKVTPVYGQGRAQWQADQRALKELLRWVRRAQEAVRSKLYNTYVEIELIDFPQEVLTGADQA